MKRDPFKTGEALLKLCAEHDKPISALMMSNEQAWRGEEEIRKNLLNIWRVMQDCIERGIRDEGVLPGGMKVKRRAANFYKQLIGEIPRQTPGVPVGTLDWVNLFALAVSEENAAINGVKLGHGPGQLLLAVADGMDHPLIRARAPYDLLIANILAGPLIDLAPDFAKSIAPGATRAPAAGR